MVPEEGTASRTAAVRYFLEANCPIGRLQDNSEEKLGDVASENRVIYGTAGFRRDV
jgi:hypothetical protein